MIHDIVEEHLDEATWLFERLQSALRSELTSDHELLEIEDRLRAHLDGLLLGGEAAWALCRNFLAKGTPGQVFAAGITALEWGERSHRVELETALTDAAGATYDGLRWACRLTSSTEVIPFLLPQLDRPEPAPRAVAIDALTARGLDPSPSLDEALREPPGPLLIAALRGAGRLGLIRVRQRVADLTASDDPEVCGAALESLVILDPERGCLRCREALEAEGPGAPAAASLLGLIGRAEDLPVLEKSARSSNRKLARAGALALGSLGDPRAVPTLIQVLGIPHLAGIAGVALRRILGADCPEERALPADAHVESESDEAEAWSQDDDLPRLSSAAVKRWWEENGARILQGSR
ncbi:MAG: hypothetical protein HZB55_17775 [Deltaproteobacteria bacterium]|nr:hypothetical protein [Deltaproteobacteria bacterium]